jgi:hypothetical protein
MATWVGHSLLGYGVGRAAGVRGWGLVGCAALANAPDLDLLAGLALEGDAGAYHRMWWNHSPVIALYGAAGVLGVHAARSSLRGRPFVAARATRDAWVVAAVLLTHVLADYVIVNPAVMVPVPPIEDFGRATARQALLLLTDLLLYGAFILLGWMLLLRARGEPARPATALRRLLP